MYQNRLTFEDIIIQQSPRFKIDYQQWVGENTTAIVDEGESYTIDLGIDQDVSNNQYIWFKDEIAIDTTNINHFTVSAIDAEDEGVYTCMVSNPDAPHYLLLFSNPVGVFIDYDKRSTSEQDSLALVKLYHATNGDNWIRNDNWLTGPLNTWYGIRAWKVREAPDDKPRVGQVFLSNNGLEGELPGEIQQLTFVNQFDVSYNKLRGAIPIVSTPYPHDSVSFNNNYFTGVFPEIDQLPGILIISQNNLTFEDLLPLVAKDSIHRRGDRIWYEHSWGYDQRLIGRDTVVHVKENESYTFNSSIDLTVADNKYIWFKDSVAIDTTNAGTYTLAEITQEDSGFYTYQVTNPRAEGVTLYSHSAQIVVEALPTQTIHFDSLTNPFVGDTLHLQATATSQLPVSFSIIGPARLMEDQLLFTDTGQVTITVHQAGDSRYAAAESVSQTIQVAERLKTSTHYALSGQVWQEENILYQ